MVAGDGPRALPLAARAVLPALVAAGVAAHLALIALFNTPANPLKTAFTSEINGYVAPLFYQNWSFFAPEPIDRNVFLLARARLRDGRTTAWFNVSMPYIEALQRNRLTSKELIVTGISNSLLDMAKEPDLFQLIATKRASLLDVRQGPHILYRVGAAFLARRYPPAQIAAVQIAMEQDEFPRFRHRFADTSSVKPLFIYLPMRRFPKNLEAMPW